MISVEILPDADRDALLAALWYAEHRPERRPAFLLEYRATVERAIFMPAAGTLVPKIRFHAPVRRYAFDRFPYSVIATAFERRFVVVAIAHDRRSTYWRKRLAKVRR